ncbi:MAG: 7-cyano-7-deazaguanine synthase [Acidimicrobiia bacterium]|nr:7-cyano-7-deazaguanine synthase [Acidimicrobiia bacterium]
MGRTGQIRSAVLASGGVDSTVLLAEELSAGHEATPIHVRSGFAWEDAEERALCRLLTSPLFLGSARPLVTLSAPVDDVYPADHWAITGSPPGLHTPDAAVYLEGRNLLLITKAATWCRRHDVSRLVIGSLAGNPFPDATTGFFQAASQAASVGLAHPIEVAAPFLIVSKADVVVRGHVLGVPLELTLSCMKPGPGDSHCRKCSKCRERWNALSSW